MFHYFSNLQWTTIATPFNRVKLFVRRQFGSSCALSILSEEFHIMFSETVKRSVLPFIASVHATGHATVSLRCHVAFHRTRSIPPLRQCNATFALLRIGPEHWSAEIARPCRGVVNPVSPCFLPLTALLLERQKSGIHIIISFKIFFSVQMYVSESFPR